MKPLRLFWAINLPADIKTKLASIQVQLKKVRPDVKWVEEENFHLTVKFLGDIDPGNIPAIVRRVKNEIVGLGTIRLGMQKLGVFGRKGVPRVLWVGIYGEKDKLVILHNHVEKAIIPLGFVPEGKKFSPHLTLGRVRSSRGTRELLEMIDDINSRDSFVGEVMVKTIDLMQSELTRHGPVYSVLEEVCL